jgi:hypothetical protein
MKFIFLDLLKMKYCEQRVIRKDNCIKNFHKIGQQLQMALVTREYTDALITATMTSSDYPQVYTYEFNAQNETEKYEEADVCGEKPVRNVTHVGEDLPELLEHFVQWACSVSSMMASQVVLELTITGPEIKCHNNKCAAKFTFEHDSLRNVSLDL